MAKASGPSWTHQGGVEKGYGPMRGPRWIHVFVGDGFIRGDGFPLTRVNVGISCDGSAPQSLRDARVSLAMTLD